MTTNQTIDGVLVPRELLSYWAECLESAGFKDRPAEMRALLGAPEKPSGDPAGSFEKHMQYMRENIELKNRIAELEAAQPQGEPVAYRVVFSDGEKSRWEDGTPQAQDLYDVRDGVIRGIERAYSEQPVPVAVASLEIVGRQCFPSEAMKAVQGYRKEPWVDGEVDQLPSEPGFYRVEPLVRLSDVTAPVAVAKQLERLKTRAWAVMQGALDGASVHPCDEHSEEVKVRTLAQAYQDLYASLTASPK